MSDFISNFGWLAATGFSGIVTVLSLIGIFVSAINGNTALLVVSIIGTIIFGAGTIAAFRAANH